MENGNLTHGLIRILEERTKTLATAADYWIEMRIRL
jgi:hypothetical protein